MWGCDDRALACEFQTHFSICIYEVPGSKQCFLRPHSPFAATHENSYVTTHVGRDELYFVDNNDLCSAYACTALLEPSPTALAVPCLAAETPAGPFESRIMSERSGGSGHAGDCDGQQEIGYCGLPHGFANHHIAQL